MRECGTHEIGSQELAKVWVGRGREVIASGCPQMRAVIKRISGSNGERGLIVYLYGGHGVAIVTDVGMGR